MGDAEISCCGRKLAALTQHRTACKIADSGVYAARGADFFGGKSRFTEKNRKVARMGACSPSPEVVKKAFLTT